MAFLIKNGKIINPAKNTLEKMDLIIEGKFIKQIMPSGQFTNYGPQLEFYDAVDKYIVPGMVDMHVHLREPGFEYKETITTGSLAAAASGFTSIACMPNTMPVNDHPEITEFILEQASKNGLVTIYPIAAITKNQRGKMITDFERLHQSGAVAVSDDGYPVVSAKLMRQALIRGANNGLMVISHCEDRKLSLGGVMHAGIVSEKLGLPGIPAMSEEIMVRREIFLARLTKCPVHIAHVSTAGSVELIRRAKEAGIPVTAETAPHYFTLDHTAVMGYDANTKMNPPLRSSKDVAAIKRGLNEGVIDAIATDHAPHHALDKGSDFIRAAFGIIGIETALPLTLALVREGILTMSEAIKKLSYNPARILGIDGGEITPGAPADLAIIDPSVEYIFKEEHICSKSKNTPFLGKTLKGVNYLTMHQGKVVWERNADYIDR